MDSDNPIILISSCSSIKPKSLVKLISGVSSLKEENNGHVKQMWNIETKYYSAIVDIYGITDEFQYEQDLEFKERVEAIVIHMDTNKDTGLLDLEKWNGLTEQSNPEIKLLICNYCNDKTKISKESAVDWCLKRGFEFIELYPKLEPNSKRERDIIEEKFGIDRIVEALQTHFWPNMIRKETGSQNSRGKQAVKSNEEMYVDPDIISELFSEMSLMRERNKQSISSTERKQYAEQMMTKLWRAIEGDDEEILDV